MIEYGGKMKYVLWMIKLCLICYECVLLCLISYNVFYMLDKGKLM